MRRNRVLLAMLFVMGCAVNVFATTPEKPSPVHGQGCITGGAETRCLLVRDLKTGKLFNLIFKGIQPAPGEAIEFEGLPHQGSTTCMQGTALDVTGWVHKDTLKCKPGTARIK